MSFTFFRERGWGDPNSNFSKNFFSSSLDIFQGKGGGAKSNPKRLMNFFSLGWETFQGGGVKAVHKKSQVKLFFFFLWTFLTLDPLVLDLATITLQHRSTSIHLVQGGGVRQILTLADKARRGFWLLMISLIKGLRYTIHIGFS